MLKVSTNISGLKNLQSYIINIEKIASIKNSSEYTKFLQKKVMETLNQVMNERLGGTTNDEFIEEYKLRNKIIDVDDGFILYNDFTIPATLSTKSTKTRNYSSGFSIALAFEYGVGIVGKEKPKVGAWEYNINEYENGWYYKSSTGEIIWTRGYEGLEIYRFTKDRIEKNMSSWFQEYMRNEVNND